MYPFRRIELDEVVGEMLLGGDGVVSTVVASGFLVKRKKTIEGRELSVLHIFCAGDRRGLCATDFRSCHR